MGQRRVTNEFVEVEDRTLMQKPEAAYYAAASTGFTDTVS